MHRPALAGAMEAGLQCKTAFRGNGWSSGWVCTCPSSRGKADGHVSPAKNSYRCYAYTTPLRKCFMSKAHRTPADISCVSVWLEGRTLAAFIPRGAATQCPRPSIPSVMRGYQGVALPREHDIERNPKQSLLRATSFATPASTWNGGTASCLTAIILPDSADSCSSPCSRSRWSGRQPSMDAARSMRWQMSPQLLKLSVPLQSAHDRCSHGY
jgi:hypothetical protein